MAQSAEFMQAKLQAIATGKSELSFGERLKEARRQAAKEQISATLPVKTQAPTVADDHQINPAERQNYRGAYKTKRPANRISVDEAVAREKRQQKREEELQALLKERNELRAIKQEEKKKEKAIAAQRLKEAKAEKRDQKLPEYIVGEPDANGKIPVKVLDHQNTRLWVKPGANIEALIRKLFFRPENEIKPLAYYSPNSD